MPDHVSTTASLADLALSDLRQEFAGYGHNPSPDQWSALEALLRTFDAIATGIAEPALFLSALDPGVGKTSAVIAYLRRLMSSPVHGQVGVLLCLSKLTEIRRLTEALSGAGNTIAIMTGDDDLNAFSNAEPDQAQLLITTQQRLERMSRGSRKFGDARTLFFKGTVRALRIWDESFLPGRTVTPSSAELAAMLRVVERTNPEARGWMFDLVTRLEKATDGEIISIPVWDFADDGKKLSSGTKELQKRAEAGDKAAQEDRQTIEDLQALSGLSFSARRNGAIPSRSLAGYRRTLPADLLPLVVLDASGRVRRTYADLATGMALTHLPSAVKDYRNLTINVWSRGGGKSGFDNEQKVGEVIETMVALIGGDDTYQGKWLVICHKPGSQVPDIEKRLKARLAPDTMTRMAFLTWGNHAAINDHGDAERVILVGTLFYPDAYYEALARLCLDKGPDDHPLTAGDMKATVLGESGHLVLQGLCRASVRKSDNGVAGACTANLVASARSGIKEALPTWFPGCQVGSWMPQGPKALSGHALTVANYLAQWAKGASPGDKVRFSKIYLDLGIQDDVFRSVRANPALKEHLASVGIIEGGGKRLMTSYVLQESD